MRDGDVDGLWHLLEASQKYGYCVSGKNAPELINDRNAIFMSHVPWLGALFLRFPNLAKDLKAFRAYAKKRAISRKKEGSSHKDLFFHLVRGVIIILGTSLTSSTDRRRWHCK